MMITLPRRSPTRNLVIDRRPAGELLSALLETRQVEAGGT